MKSLVCVGAVADQAASRPFVGAWTRGWLCIFVIFSAVSDLSAQLTAVIDTAAQKPGAIEGSVFHAFTGLPLRCVTIDLSGTSVSVLADRDGSFRINHIAPGTYSLKITAQGMRPVRITDVAVAPGRMVQLRPIDLRPAPRDGVEELEVMYISASQLLIGADDFAMSFVPLAQVVITPSSYGMVEEAMASSSSVGRSDLEALPQLAEDVYRAVSRLPGLASTDASARFWVRGAPNDQVLSRFDGVDLVEPFHVKDFDGALSIIDLETVGRIDLITGGFTAEYGNRMAGVLSMETEDFDPTRPSNTLGVSLTAVRGTHRGQFADGRGNWLVAARGGYPDLLLSNQWEDTGDLKTRYYDFSAKIEYRLSPTNDVSFHVLHARDTLRFEEPDSPTLASSYGGDYVWGRWRGTIGDNLSGEGVLSYSRSAWSHTGLGKLSNTFDVDLRDDRTLNTLGLRQDWTATLSERALARFGFDLKWAESGYAYHLTRERSPADAADGLRILFVDVSSTQLPEKISVNVDRDEDGSTLGAYLAPRIRVTRRLMIEPSVRFDWQDYSGDKTVSPRFNISWSSKRTTLRGAWGIYYQAQGLHQLAIPDNDYVFHPAERAEHRVISIEHRFGTGIMVRAEAYERLLSRLRPRWENAVNVREIFPELRYDRLQFDPVRGTVRGFELSAGSRGPQPFNWAVTYALAAAREKVVTFDKKGLIVIPRTLDQRHTLSIDVGYVPNPRWSFSAAWQFHSGWPSTDVSFRRAQLKNGAVIIADVGEPFASRLPNYHRLDLRVTRHFQFRQGSLRLFADVFNAYNRKNVQGYEFTPKEVGDAVVTEKRALKQFSFLPNLGAVWEF